MSSVSQETEPTANGYYTWVDAQSTLQQYPSRTFPRLKCGVVDCVIKNYRYKCVPSQSVPLTRAGLVCPLNSFLRCSTIRRMQGPNSPKSLSHASSKHEKKKKKEKKETAKENSKGHPMASCTTPNEFRGARDFWRFFFSMYMGKTKYREAFGGRGRIKQQSNTGRTDKGDYFGPAVESKMVEIWLLMLLLVVFCRILDSRGQREESHR